MRSRSPQIYAAPHGVLSLSLPNYLSPSISFTIQLQSLGSPAPGHFSWLHLTAYPSSAPKLKTLNLDQFHHSFFCSFFAKRSGLQKMWAVICIGVPVHNKIPAYQLWGTFYVSGDKKCTSVLSLILTATVEGSWYFSLFCRCRPNA